MLFGLFGTCHWISRHFFELQQFDEKKVGKKTGFILIITQLSTILSSLVSSFILDNYNLGILVFISFSLMISSLFFMWKLPENKKKETINIKAYFRVMPTQTLFHLALRQANVVISNLFTLYLFIFVKSSYGFIGIVNVLLGIAAMVFTYFISKKLDDNRHDYLLLSVVLLCFVYLFKINLTSGLIMIVIFGEGIVKQFYDSVSHANFYLSGKNNRNLSFLIGNEFYTNLIKVIILLIGYFLLTDFTKYMYFCIGLMVLAGFVPYQVKKNKIGECTHDKKIIS